MCSQATVHAADEGVTTSTIEGPPNLELVFVGVAFGVVLGVVAGVVVLGTLGVGPGSVLAFTVGLVSVKTPNAAPAPSTNISTMMPNAVPAEIPLDFLAGIRRARGSRGS